MVAKKKRSLFKKFSGYYTLCLLLLLVGDILPKSSAASLKSAMENSLWGNPCDIGENSKPGIYSTQHAIKVAAQARNAFDRASSYQDELAQKLHSYKSFNKLLTLYSNTKWLRNFTWFPQEGLPEDKVLNSQVSNETLNTVMERIDNFLPLMYKGLKMVVAGLYSISEEGLNDGILSDASLKQNITQSMYDVRAVLCRFYELIRSRGLEVLPLPDAEVPQIRNMNKLTYALLVYRDTLNYLEYIEQVFQRMATIDSTNSE